MLAIGFPRNSMTNTGAEIIAAERNALAKFCLSDIRQSTMNFLGLADE